jgi:hypothetical protein
MSFPESFVDTPWGNCQTLGVLWRENGNLRVLGRKRSEQASKFGDERMYPGIRSTNHPRKERGRR